MSGFYDISPLISERLGTFPGDVPFRRDISLAFEKGHHLGLSSITTSVHVGAHADGPNHYRAGAPGIGERDLRLYMGRCLVIEAKAPRGARIEKRHLGPQWQDQGPGDWKASRILVKTESFPDPEKWNADFNSLSPELIGEWATAGVRLVGIDTPSIDPEDAKTLSSHHQIAAHDMAILEGLVLTEVPEGYYTLMALPLKIEHGDAAPVRAILFKNAELIETT